ncbi:MAG: hypothetical protein MUF45_14750 [Spirosomaceae bacterium]|jgi:hypothetical protein|nr:hypothetical protein [Spirosomataceae bacterium]
MQKITKNIVLTLIFISISKIVIAQVTANDTLTTKRKIITTDIYLNGTPLTKKSILSLYTDNRQATIKYKWGNAMKPLGIPVAVGGIALAANAIRGVDMVATIDGKDYPYVKRSLPKLLLGIVLVVGGGCLIESSNELVTHSADKYNEALREKNSKKTAYFGITNDGIGIGIKW